MSLTRFALLALVLAVFGAISHAHAATAPEHSPTERGL